MTRRTHRHYCVNHDQGCVAFYICTAPVDPDDEDRRHCVAEPPDGWLCEDCAEALKAEEDATHEAIVLLDATHLSVCADWQHGERHDYAEAVVALVHAKWHLEAGVAC